MRTVWLSHLRCLIALCCQPFSPSALTMNHAQARAPTQHAAALQAVLQFLRENGYQTSLETLEQESETAYDETMLENSPAHLLTALTTYEDQRAGAFKKKAQDPELLIITQWMVRATNRRQQHAHPRCATLS
jgi:hypothetical protein